MGRIGHRHAVINRRQTAESAALLFATNRKLAEPNSLWQGLGNLGGRLLPKRIHKLLKCREQCRVREAFSLDSIEDGFGEGLSNICKRGPPRIRCGELFKGTGVERIDHCSVNVALLPPARDKGL